MIGADPAIEPVFDGSSHSLLVVELAVHAPLVPAVGVGSTAGICFCALADRIGVQS